MLNAIHVTHEAVYKVGGIGTVLEGLINAEPYRAAVDRTILVCPLFWPENTNRFGAGGLVEYSSLDGIAASPYDDAFRHIESRWHTPLVYGRRPLEDDGTGRRCMVEVLLVDLRSINQGLLGELKGRLWEDYQLESNRYEHIWEFEQYVQVAGPAAEAMQAMQFGIEGRPAVVFAHEFMGVPAALTLKSYEPSKYFSLFHAHEVAPIRRIVEDDPGHDVKFYNVLEKARQQGQCVTDVFGPQDDFHKFALVTASGFCDGVLAVGHHVVEEYQFLTHELAEKDVTLAFNGIPAREVTPAERQASVRRMKQYCKNLLGWKPDHIFTHVTRLAPSKALWRDLDALLLLDETFQQSGKTAVHFVLSTQMPRKRFDTVCHMESEWDWPLGHREGGSDLTGDEAEFNAMVQAFNARARNIRVVFINQWGFDREGVGLRVPEDAELLDLRRASDVEFGAALYEPFGISPLEPLTYGGLCVISTSCGCAGFVDQVMDGEPAPNVILADYIHGGGKPSKLSDALAIDRVQRRKAELKVARHIADAILARLPQSAAEEKERLRIGFALAQQMSWDAVASQVIVPAMQRAAAPLRVVRPASS